MASRGEGLVLTGLVLTIATWGNVPATLIGSGLATRFGGLRVFVFGTSALVIGITGAALSDYPVAWAVVIGIFGSFHPGVIMAVGTLSARPENRAVGMSLFYSLYYAGNAVVPTMCGWAADITGGPGGRTADRRRHIRPRGTNVSAAPAALGSHEGQCVNPNIRDLCRATLFGPTRATNRCVVPLWHGCVLHGVEDATLLWVTDEPIMVKFGLHRA